MKEAVIVSAVRTAVGKAPKGTLRNTRPDEMGAAVIKEAMARVPGLEASEIEDVIMGCAMPEAEQGMNVARAAAIRAGLAGRNQRHDHQSFLFVRLAVDCHGGRSHSRAAARK